MVFLVGLATYAAVFLLYEYLLVPPSPVRAGIQLTAGLVAGGIVALIRSDTKPTTKDRTSKGSERDSFADAVLGGTAINPDSDAERPTGEWSPLKKATGIALLVVGSLTLLALVDSIGVTSYGSPPPESPSAAMTTTTATATTTTTTTASRNQDLAFVTLGDLGVLVDEWNSNQIDWIVAFHDPDVGLDEYLRTVQRVFLDQAKVVAAIRVAVAALPEELRPVFTPILAHYQERLSLLRTLFQASNGTDADFQEALAEYMQFIQQNGLASIEAVVRHPALSEVLTAEEVEIVIETLTLGLGQ